MGAVLLARFHASLLEILHQSAPEADPGELNERLNRGLAWAAEFRFTAQNDIARWFGMTAVHEGFAEATLRRPALKILSQRGPTATQKLDRLQAWVMAGSPRA